MATTQIHRLKNLITVPKVTFNPKHKPEFSLKCMANYVFTTNSSAPMPIEATDRRFAAFYCSEARMQDKNYFEGLSEHMANDRVQRAFYQYLLEHVSLEGVKRDLQQQRPVTQYYKDLQQQELKPLMRWLSVLCHRSGGGAREVDVEYNKVLSGALFERFKLWMQSNYPREVEFLKGPQFGKELKDLCCKGLSQRPEGNRFHAGGLVYTKGGGNTTYSFRFKVLLLLLLLHLVVLLLLTCPGVAGTRGAPAEVGVFRLQHRLLRLRRSGFFFWVLVS